MTATVSLEYILAEHWWVPIVSIIVVIGFLFISLWFLKKAEERSK